MSDASRARVRVPATSANLGAGFDCVGVAVDRWLSAAVDVPADSLRHPPELTITRRGTVASMSLGAEDDAVYAGFKAACAARGKTPPAGMHFVIDSEIPFARGLGSSSAALVAGARLANAVLSLAIDDSELAHVCARIEGHADNVAPAVFGGAMLAVPAAGDPGGHWVFAPLETHPSIAFVFVVPSYSIETASARAILPRVLAHPTAAVAAAK